MGKILPIVLAGGSGSRLWPVSRETFPKQLLELTGNRSLLQTTLLRVSRIKNAYSPIIIVGEDHKFIAKNQLDELSLSHDYTILLEPLGRDTAPAICGAVEYVRRRKGDKVVLLILPADHLIEKEDEFYKAVLQASKLAEAGRIVTFGVHPLRPETGYGYIEKGTDGEIVSFREKPGIEQAKEYFESGNYYWNSGMFAFTVNTFQAEMKHYALDMHNCMDDAVETGDEDGDFFRFNPESMDSVEGISIDYALMEKTKIASVVPVDLGWIDIGSWQALWQVLERDKDGNVCKGDVVLEETRNSMVVAEDKLVAAVGLEDTVVIETADSVLVSSMSSVQSVKKIVKKLKHCGREEFRHHTTVYRPWGNYTAVESQQRYKIKKVIVNPLSELSLHKHYHRFEHWIVVSGTAKITIGKNVSLLYENESNYIPAGIIHRLENPASTHLELIEIQIGSYLGDDDIELFNDQYASEE